MEPGHTWVVDVYVETDRLVLRRFTLDDLELGAELDGDPQVKRYIDGGAPVDRRELAETLKDPDLVKRMADAGLKATSLDAAAFGALIRKERDEMQAVVKSAGIQPE